MKKIIGRLRCMLRGKCQKFNGGILSVSDDGQSFTAFGTCKDCGKQIIRRVEKNEIRSVEIIKKL